MIPWLLSDCLSKPPRLDSFSERNWFVAEKEFSHGEEQEALSSEYLKKKATFNSNTLQYKSSHLTNHLLEVTMKARRICSTCSNNPQTQLRSTNTGYKLSSSKVLFSVRQVTVQREVKNLYCTNLMAVFITLADTSRSIEHVTGLPMKSLVKVLSRSAATSWVCASVTDERRADSTCGKKRYGHYNWQTGYRSERHCE